MQNSFPPPSWLVGCVNGEVRTPAVWLERLLATNAEIGAGECIGGKGSMNTGKLCPFTPHGCARMCFHQAGHCSLVQEWQVLKDFHNSRIQRNDQEVPRHLATAPRLKASQAPQEKVNSFCSKVDAGEKSPLEAGGVVCSTS